MARGKKHREQRPHTPDVLGPRLIKHGRFYGVDMRPWGGGRPTLRDPSHPEWPTKGERTESLEVAERWRWDYYAHAQDSTRRRQLGLPAKQTRTLRRAAKEWLEHREHEVEHRTWISNRTAVNRLTETLGEARSVTGITSDDIQRVLYALLKAGYQRSTVITERAMLSAFFKWLDLPVNPVAKVKLPQPVDKEPFMWSDAQIETLRKAADTVDSTRVGVPVARLAVEIALATGARQQEVFALRWEDFNPTGRRVRITRQLSRHEPGKFKALKGKAGRTAVVLPSWQQRHDPERTGLILPRTDGEPFGYRQTSIIVQRILDTANLNAPGRGWHTFRHTYGRIFLIRTKGSGMHLLQQSLGHKSLSTTERIYGHLAETSAAELAEGMIYGDGRTLRVVK